jgi:hypothetical protein
MSIDQLIRDLIVEDQFKAKYTKRQRSIFCNNMYNKVANFIEDHEKDTLVKLEMHYQANLLMKNKMIYYHAMFILYRTTTFILCVCIYLKYLFPKQQIVAKR